ncbi:unnamed protein product [Polarella glacialis]|nr:unnamed protein product [Polarella glacialis]
MRATERTPMTVVSYRDFVAHGSVPRSSDRLQRLLGEGDITVFVSHRWWGDAASARDWNAHVDNDKGYKFQILCRGLRKLAEKHGLDLDKLVIWMDFACIEQDIPELLLAGVESLLSYASRSQFILIPVFPKPAAVQAFQDAEHPMDLLDYGERGWCRLEAYVFLCLGEITGQAVSCCGYGLLFQCKDSNVFSEELKALGTKQGCFGFKSSYEQLKPLMSGSAAFKREQLPSSGKFSVESDRVVILATEARIQNVYCRHAILSATAEYLNLKDHMTRSQFALDAKQLTCAQMPLLITQLQRIQMPLQDTQFKRTQSFSYLRKLSLQSNQLRLSGLYQLLKHFVCQPEGSELQELNLKDNQLGEGVMPRKLVEVAALLRSPSCARLRVLKLSGNQLASSAAVLVKAGWQLDVLDLASNNLGNEGAKGITEVLKGQVDDPSSLTRGSQSQWQRLDLGSNGISDATAEELLTAAMQASVTVGMSGNMLSAKVFGKAAILDANAIF